MVICLWSSLVSIKQSVQIKLDMADICMDYVSYTVHAQSSSIDLSRIHV